MKEVKPVMQVWYEGYLHQLKWFIEFINDEAMINDEHRQIIDKLEIDQDFKN